MCIFKNAVSSVAKSYGSITAFQLVCNNIAVLHNVHTIVIGSSVLPLGSIPVGEILYYIISETRYLCCIITDN